MTEQVKVIDEAIKLIDRGWTQGADAKDVNGLVVHLHHPSACKFCMNGALTVAYSRNKEITSSQIITISFLINIEIARKGELGFSVPRDTIMLYNDTPGRKKEEVISILEGVKQKLN